MKKIRFTYLFLSLIVPVFGQNKKPVTFGIETGADFFIYSYKQQKIQTGSRNSYMYQEEPFESIMYSVYFLTEKRLSKRLSIETKIGVGILFNEPLLRDYRDTKNITTYRMLGGLNYHFEKKWHLIMPTLGVNFGYLKQHYTHILNQETKIDFKGGMIFELKAKVGIKNRKYKKLAPFKFFISYNNYFENSSILINYTVQTPTTENVNAPFKIRAESISYGIQYYFPHKKKKLE